MNVELDTIRNQIASLRAQIELVKEQTDALDPRTEILTSALVETERIAMSANRAFSTLDESGKTFTAVKQNANRPDSRISRRILVTEDEKGIRSAIVRSLELKGHQAFSASNQEEALELVKNKSIEILITDLRLDEFAVDDGIALFEQLKAIRPELKLVVMTGYASAESTLRALRLGALDYLCKPFKLELLLNAIEKDALSNSDAGNQLPNEIPFSIQIELNLERINIFLAQLRKIAVRENLPKRAYAALFLASKEALLNAMQHAYPNQQGKAWIEMRRADNSLWVQIQDRGKGFAASSTLSRILSAEPIPNCGLRRMQRPVDDLRIHSEKDKGSTVSLRISLSSHRENNEQNLLKQVLWA